MPAQHTILVINCGSSSLKYQLIDPHSEEVLAAGLVERIGEPVGHLSHKCADGTFTSDDPLPDHEAALAAVDKAFAEHGPKLEEAGIQAVGHRVVHGGERFREPALIDDDVIAAIDELSALAPLHNPPSLMGIKAAMKIRDDVPHVAVFDTAFFANLPPEAYTYAIDRSLAERHDIRRYGFHGTSHSYVSRAAARVLNRPVNAINQIVLHLGNGASVSAIQRGRAVDTSMGLTPLEGLVMGTRPGDIDPGIPGYLARSAGMTAAEIDQLLNKKSGLLGLCGVNDFRELLALRDKGDDAATLAFDIYARRIRKYIGAYLAVLGHVDILTFTAGIGEHNAALRSAVIGPLSNLGLVLDEGRNNSSLPGVRVISADDSPITIMVVPTNEELAIARETLTMVTRRAAEH